MMNEQSHLPIDRGWAWVITFASSGIFGFITGSQKNRGIILVELEERFPESSVASLIWILNINFITDRAMGPLNGIILAHTSNRILSVLGSCIMTASLIMFAYVPSTEYLYAAYALYGWGTGMNALSAMTAYQPYFNKRKGLSLGITGSGSGFGTILLSVILRLLFDNYSFSGAILIYAGICLQTLALACLLRPFSYYEQFNQRNSDCTVEVNTEDSKTEEDDSPIATYEKGEVRMRSFSVGGDGLLPVNSAITGAVSTPTNLNTPTKRSEHHTATLKLSNAQVLALSAQDITNAALILDKQTPVTVEFNGKEENKAKNKSSLNWRLAYNPRCILLGICTLLHVSALMAAYPSIPPLGQQTGVSKKLVSILLAAAGGLEIPMRMFNGWLADKKVLSAYNQLILSMVITGITALLCATISGVAGIVVMLVGLSSIGTSVFTLLPIACAELFGSANVRSGMSIIFVYQGISILVSSFATGGIYGRTNNWEHVFYYIAASKLTAGCLMLVTSGIAHCVNKHKTGRSSDLMNTDNSTL